jgi:CubicO group peptidase (beta-lactamase class C family)
MPSVASRLSMQILPALAIATLAVLWGCGTAPRAAAPAPAAEIPAVTAAMRAAVDRHEVAGAVTLVIGPERVLHLSAVGQADVAAGTPMRTDSLFWIASMTKPITATAILMLQDQGKLSIDDPVAKYIPELGEVKTADGIPGNLTLRHLLTHTSGLAEVAGDEGKDAHTLADLIPLFARKPLQFAPGTKWQYCQTGINSLGRVVEVVSGQSFPDFLQSRLFTPLGMVDTTFYPTAEQRARLAKTYQLKDGALAPASLRRDFDPAIAGRVPMANGGLFSTAGDYGRFCQMLLGHGTVDGKPYLSAKAVALMSTVSSGELKTGFTPGNGWGLGVCVIREPQGVSAALSPGSFGHGGAYGTQAWIDPVKQVAYVLMVQRSNFPNSDGSDIRRDFQNAAAGALATK